MLLEVLVFLFVFLIVLGLLTDVREEAFGKKKKKTESNTKSDININPAVASAPVPSLPAVSHPSPVPYSLSSHSHSHGNPFQRPPSVDLRQRATSKPANQSQSFSRVAAPAPVSSFVGQSSSPPRPHDFEPGSIPFSAFSIPSQQTNNNGSAGKKSHSHAPQSHAAQSVHVPPKLAPESFSGESEDAAPGEEGQEGQQFIASTPIAKAKHHLSNLSPGAPIPVSGGETSTTGSVSTSDPDDSVDFAWLLHEGANFLKFGRWGAPHVRTLRVQLKDKKVKLDWGSDKIDLDEITDIRTGKTTAVFQKAANDRLSDASKCFSIVTAKRTLDLQAESSEQRDQWVRGLREITNLRDNDSRANASDAKALNHQLVQAALKQRKQKSGELSAGGKPTEAKEKDHKSQASVTFSDSKEDASGPPELRRRPKLDRRHTTNPSQSASHSHAHQQPAGAHPGMQFGAPGASFSGFGSAPFASNFAPSNNAFHFPGVSSPALNFSHYLQMNGNPNPSNEYYNPQGISYAAPFSFSGSGPNTNQFPGAINGADRGFGQSFPSFGAPSFKRQASMPLGPGPNPGYAHQPVPSPRGPVAEDPLNSAPVLNRRRSASGASGMPQPKSPRMGGQSRQSRTQPMH